MALVVAESFQAAEEAAAKVKAQYEPEQPSADLDSARNGTPARSRQRG
jgi:CO/xanthine dehydrogenase Mo-binding subunit